MLVGRWKRDDLGWKEMSKSEELSSASSFLHWFSLPHSRIFVRDEGCYFRLSEKDRKRERERERERERTIEGKEK
jgi:hypothetical protein